MLLNVVDNNVHFHNNFSKRKENKHYRGGYSQSQLVNKCPREQNKILLLWPWDRSKFLSFFFFSFVSMWDLSLLISGQTHAPCIGSTVLTTGPPKKSGIGKNFLNRAITM